MLLTKETLSKAIPEHDSVREVAKFFGVKSQLIYKRMRDWGLSRDEFRDRDEGKPSLEEIEAAAAEIRATWSPAEMRRRIVGGPKSRWTPPAYRFGELVSVSRR
jgi:Zn-dependent peptidase ImmA (M78 family)